MAKGYVIQLVSFRSLDNSGAYNTLTHKETPYQWQLDLLKEYIQKHENPNDISLM